MRGNCFACRATANCQFRLRRTAGDLLFLSGQDPVTPEDKKHGKVGRGVIEEEAYRRARWHSSTFYRRWLYIGVASPRLRIVKVLGW